MKKLFLILTFLPQLLGAAAAAVDSSVSHAAIPDVLNTNLPNVRTIDLGKIIALLKPLGEKFIDRTGDIPKLEFHKATFPYVKSLILKDEYIKSFGPHTDALASLLAYLYTSLTFKFKNPIPGVSVTPSCCSCILLEYRVAQALVTILLIKDKYHTQQAQPIHYVSLASGHLKQDYITVSGLIKLGIVPLRINLIDPLYTFEKSKESFKTISDYLDNERIFTRTEYIKLLLQEELDAYAHATNQKISPENLVITTWSNTDRYVKLVKQAQKMLQNGELAPRVAQLYIPTVAVLSDSAEEIPMKTDILHSFNKIVKTMDPQNSIISILDHENPHVLNTLFLTLKENNENIISFRQQNEIHPSGQAPPIPAPRLLEHEMEGLVRLIKRGMDSLDNVLKELVPPIDQERFTRYFHNHAN